MATNTEAPNNLLSTTVFKVTDLLCEGPISGFVYKNGPYGNDPLVSTRYDDVPVRNLDGSYNYAITGVGYSFSYMLGTASQTGMTGFQKVESVIPLSSNTRIANPPPNAGPFKPVIASFNSNIYPDADAVKVTVRVPALFAQDDNGNTNPYEIVYAVDISMNNGAFVEQKQTTIRGKCTSPYQQTTTYVLPKSVPATAYSEWKVRVRRVSQNILSLKTANEIYVDTISVISASMYANPYSVEVGTQIGADQFSSIPSRVYEIAGLLVSVPAGMTPTQYGYAQTPFTRNCSVDAGIKHIPFTTQAAAQADGINIGMAVTGVGIPANSIVTAVNQGPPYYFTIDQDPTATNSNVTVSFTPTETVPTITPAVYPNIWTGSFQTGVWTDNPAWIFYDLLTNPVHGLGDIIPATAVDKWSLYRISQYCDQMVDDGAGGLEPRFTCNVNITQPTEAYNVLLNMASVFRGMLYYANGAIHATQNQDDPPVYEFTNANVVNGNFVYSDTARNTRSTVAVVKWVDPDNGYRENVEYIEDTDGILRYGYREKQMTAFATTSRGQAIRLGSWTLETERLLTETVTFQTTQEGVALSPGDNFAIYDNFRNNRSQGGRVVSFDTGRSLITLDRPVEVSASYIYSLSAIIPKFQLDGTGDVTGSNQISQIHQSQVESLRVVTPLVSPTNQLLVSGSFTTGLVAGAPFILSMSGNADAFQSASFYTCLATAEVSPGVVEVLGLQANSGINFAISTGYTTAVYPDNHGDQSPILPPTNLRITGVTGLTATNAFYSSIQLSWNDTPDPVAYYVLSGKEWDTSYEEYNVLGNTYNFVRGDTGQYLFKLASVSPGGVISTFVTGGWLIGASQQNPLGTLQKLSGVRLVENYDPYLKHPTSGYTGYVGINPEFDWTIPVDYAGNTIVDAAFISGWRWTAKSFDGATTYLQGEISGVDNSYLAFTGNLMDGMLGGRQRGFDLVVQSLDYYGIAHPGGNLKVNNVPPRAPFSSGFVGFNNGLSYTITPNARDVDVSGVRVWVYNDTSTPPSINTAGYYSSTNLAGQVSFNGNPITSFYSYFAVLDDFDSNGSTVYGPVSGNVASVIWTGAVDGLVSGQLSGAYTAINNAFSLSTGMITQASLIFSGADILQVATVNNLSGQIIGTTPGSANTALTTRTNSIVVSASGVLAQSVDAVSTRLVTSGQQLTATVGSVSTALTQSGVSLGSRVDIVEAHLTTTGQTVNANVQTVAAALVTTGGALSSWTTLLGANTTGDSASIKIGANAFVTGGAAGQGGVAVANWGFMLDANGKVVSMQATSSSWAGSPYGTIVFGGADLQSSTYTAGIEGWKISANGNVEFDTGEFRGNIAAARSGVLIGLYPGYSTKPYLTFPDGTIGGVVSNVAITALTTDTIGANKNWRAGQIQLANTWLNGLTNAVPGLGVTMSASAFIWASGSTSDITLSRRNHVTLNTNAVFQATGLQILSGDAVGSVPAGYLASVFNRSNSTSKYGLFVGTAWGAVENKILNVANVSAGGGTVTDYFTVFGDSTATLLGGMTAASYNTSSSLRYKDNITTLSGTLAKVETLRGVTFDWKKDGRHDLGVVAEEVATVFPEVVRYVSGAPESVDYGRLSAVLIEAVKDLSAEVKALKARVHG